MERSDRRQDYDGLYQPGGSAKNFSHLLFENPPADWAAFHSSAAQPLDQSAVRVVAEVCRALRGCHSRTTQNFFRSNSNIRWELVHPPVDSPEKLAYNPSMISAIDRNLRPNFKLGAIV